MNSKNPSLASIEEIIEEARNGRMFILVDDENRENEGDVIIPAQMATAEAVNFMAKYARGLICLALERKRVKKLGIDLMSSNNKTRHQTAFTVSIEAKEGVSTGISAHDRATTIAAAIDPAKGAEDIITPGHIFPLIARDGGVLVRAGHTEAAVDIARLAGLNPSGVICEVMNDDGSMARLPQLIEFAEAHNMKIATIADLIQYRRYNDKLIEERSITDFKSGFAGDFKLHLYVNKVEYSEHLALVKGNIDRNSDVLVRMHQLDVLSDVLGSAETGKADELKRSMQIIDENGSGVVVLLRSPNKQSLSDSLAKISNKAQTGQEKAIRDYGIGAQILLDLGIKNMVLLTNSEKTPVALDGYGLTIKGTRKIV
jgi:3,4-dihydroxy 2-butanone 4-phosphate synthase/GTP cyclohydrolase II